MLYSKVQCCYISPPRTTPGQQAVPLEEIMANIHMQGSRQRRSCLSQLLEHHEEVLKMMENGGNVYVIYTNFAKAYEIIRELLVNHEII